MYAAINVCSGVFVVWCVPETAACSLEDVQDLF